MQLWIGSLNVTKLISDVATMQMGFETPCESSKWELVDISSLLLHSFSMDGDGENVLEEIEEETFDLCQSPWKKRAVNYTEIEDLLGAGMVASVHRCSDRE
jgi:hypothetical protein